MRAKATNCNGACPAIHERLRPTERKAFASRYHALFSAACVLGVTSATAQTAPPPRHETKSPDGVSYRSGAFSYSETDLSIGGDGDDGLSLVRSYSSASSGPADIYRGTRGWTHNFVGYVSAARMPIDPDNDQPKPGTEPYIYTVTIGGRSYAFEGGSQYRANVTTTGGPVGIYYPSDIVGSSLVFNGTNSSGYYTMTGPDGLLVRFGPTANGRIVSMAQANGRRLDYSYTSTGYIKSVISNRGYALLFEQGRACAVNMAIDYITPASNCPANAATVTYGFQQGVFGQQLVTVAKAGATTTYGYNGADQLDCIKEPGQLACRIRNTYSSCPRDPANPNGQPDIHLNDAVLSQVDASGKSVAYSYGYAYSAVQPDVDNHCTVFGPHDPDHRGFRNSTVDMRENGGTPTHIVIDPDSTELTVTDPLSRIQHLTFSHDSGLDNVIFAEQDAEERTRDNRGNITSVKRHAKPGSGLPDVTSTALFPATCSSQPSCNKPLSTTDARGAVTLFAYDPTHGGVLMETAPAGATGISAVKRYAYAARRAWIRNAGGGFDQVAAPVWVLAEVRTCRSTATQGNGCAGGSADEVVTAYDYGPDNGSVGNTLLLRGVAVTADGQTRRTCYGYDYSGNRIWETKPRAGSVSCS